jgi:hypothetical protein
VIVRMVEGCAAEKRLWGISGDRESKEEELTMAFTEENGRGGVKLKVVECCTRAVSMCVGKLLCYRLFDKTFNLVLLPQCALLLQHHAIDSYSCTFLRSQCLVFRLEF